MYRQFTVSGSIHDISIRSRHLGQFMIPVFRSHLGQFVTSVLVYGICIVSVHLGQFVIRKTWKLGGMSSCFFCLFLLWVWTVHAKCINWAINISAHNTGRCTPARDWLTVHTTRRHRLTALHFGTLAPHSCTSGLGEIIQRTTKPFCPWTLHL